MDEVQNLTGATPTVVAPPKMDSLTRLKEVEQKLVGHVSAFQIMDREINQVKTVLSTAARGVDALAELIAAHLDVLGKEFKDKVTAQIEVNRETARQQKEELARNAVKGKVDAGELVAGTTINDKSLVVFTEFDKDGKELNVHYTPVWLHELPEDLRPRFIGQVAGFEAEVSGGKLRVLEVYDIGVPKTPDAIPLAGA